jgi:hypothetical protein
MRRITALITAILMIGLADCAQKSGERVPPPPEASAPPPAMKEAVAQEPVIPSNGVEFFGGPEGTVGIDHSGHGAVLCAWNIYVGLAAVLDVCFPDEEPELREDLHRGIEAMKEFIVTNSLQPVSKADLEAQVARALAQARELSTKGQCSALKSEDTVLHAIQSLPREQRRASVADLLSVPRPPVMNPCL